MSDAHGAGRSATKQGADDLRTQMSLLPTPTSRDHKGQANKPGRTRDGKPRTPGDDLLPDAVAQLLPTPKASNSENRQSADRYGPNLGMALMPDQYP